MEDLCLIDTCADSTQVRLLYSIIFSTGNEGPNIHDTGFFYNMEIMKKYDWYWRVEPGIDLYCDIE